MIKFAPPISNSTQHSFRLVHISDPHLSNLDNVTWRQLVNKRILGYLSWRFNRRKVHRMDILSTLISDLDEIKANHLVISGDLTHIGTADECQQVNQWLTSLGTSDDITVIPGNHDCYTDDDASETTNRWSEYMTSDDESNADNNDANFPSLRQRGPLAIIGLTTALPTAPFFATGRLGLTQIEKLAELLEKTVRQGFFRVVLLHHGPLMGSNKYRKRLIDAEQFRAVIKSHGAELILHGHGHHTVNGVLETDKSEIPVIGAASASLLSKSLVKRAGYNIFDVTNTGNSWNIAMQSRGYDAKEAIFKLKKEVAFTLPITS